MMSRITSEQLLKDLERSTANPSDLLDQATSIAGVVFDLSEGYTKVSQTQSSAPNDFREQWLLKWALKKLSEATRTGKKLEQANGLPNGLLYQSKFWALISYLLSAVFTHNAINICLDRNLSSLLTQAGTLLLSNYRSITESLEIAMSNDASSDRPRKRVRLSPTSASVGSTVADGGNNVPTADIALLQFIKVLNDFASILQSRQQSPSASARSIIPAWAASIKDAAAFVGSVLTCVRSILNPVTKHRSQGREVAANAAVLWLRLWHKFSTSNAAMDKNLVTRAFNEACLGSCLILCKLTSRATESYMVSTKKELEKQVALYTVLPLRSAFEAKFAAVWKQDRKTLSWLDIEPVTKLIRNHLGTALQTHTIADYQYVILPDSEWASYIISIAARLIPKDDIRRRQQETPWLDALTLSLAHLTYPKEMPRLYENSDGSLYPSSETVPPSNDLLLGRPDEILDVLTENEIRLSLSTKVYLVMSFLFWRNRPIAVSLLAKIVNIDPSIFVPVINKQKSPLPIDGLIYSLNENKTLSGSQYDHTIKTIIYPVMESFAEARDLDGLINMWLPNLEEAFRVRISASFSTDSVKGDIPVALIWDNEDVFLRFSELCQLHAPVNFGRILLTETTNGLKDVSERIGSTMDLFARVAVLQCVLQANRDPSAISSNTAQDLDDLVNVAVEVVQHQNDYQGQRWRLWSLITSLCTLNVRFNPTKSFAGVIKQRSKHFRSMSVSDVDTMRQGQRSALLMEHYNMFAWFVAQCKYTSNQASSCNSQATELLEKEIEHLTKHIRQQIRSRAEDSSSQSIHNHDFVWNGQLNNLLSIRQLVNGQIACLTAADLDVKTDIWYSLVSPLQEALPECETASARSSAHRTFSELATLYLSAFHVQSSNCEQPETTDNPDIEVETFRQSKHSDQNDGAYTKTVDEMTYDAQARLVEPDVLQNDTIKRDLEQTFQKSDQLASAFLAGAAITRTGTADLKSNPSMAKSLVSMISLRGMQVGATIPEAVLRLEICILTLKSHPLVVNQSSIDALLADIAIYSTSGIDVKFGQKLVTKSGSEDGAEAIFNRLLGVIGILLARYRRRLSGRSHLLLPVLQNLLRCFFYSPSKTYMYQNVATSNQKQAFRSSLPSWLRSNALSASSATKFSRLISSICNPTTASARSAHRTKRKRDSTSVELSDEIKKAKRIAAQYMQYLVMEYARCTLDGVIKPEVREKLLPGVYCILDAMDKNLMRAMNSAMDPSSRAIFKGLYDNWDKEWRWDQT